MTNEHPITPPPELAMHFRGVPLVPPLDCADPQSWIAAQIYQMGADQELEACPMIEQHIKRRKLKDGYQISCRKGLWKVIAPNHYWFQYFCDGEYDG
jgi:hypothetical protein